MSHHEENTENHADHGHGHKHYEAKQHSKEERYLYGCYEGSWNMCTDNYLDYIICMKGLGKGTFPVKFAWNLHWGERWHCAEQYDALKDCETQRMLKMFEEYSLDIKARS